ncbi:MAG: ribosome-associated translation inhibitor RaiA [Parvibaculum sp.]|uniref:ribosome hibernation-promoting factor, HPF/YfiA family n=1 Tax=Parvibaculum sp. TaxID=2024848 RepID=UPI003C756877
MQVLVSGHHLDVGEALRTHVSESLDNSVGKYFDKTIDAHVTLTKEGYEVRADCTVHLHSGMQISTQGRAADPYVAFDAAMERLDKRLRRYKRRLKSHANNKMDAAETFPSFVLEAGNEETEAGEDDQPIIIAEGTTTVPRLSVGDAVMKMDLSESAFVVFRNGATGGLSLVYRRGDGNIGWIDTSRDQQQQ